MNALPSDDSLTVASTHHPLSSVHPRPITQTAAPIGRRETEQRILAATQRTEGEPNANNYFFRRATFTGAKYLTLPR
jgi:hypothetical protein